MNYDKQVGLLAEKKRQASCNYSKEKWKYHFLQISNKIDDILYDVDSHCTLPKTQRNLDFTKMSLPIDVEGMLNQIAEEKETTNGYFVRETEFKDSCSDIKIALLNNVTKLKENKWYILTDVELKQY